MIAIEICGLDENTQNVLQEVFRTRDKVEQVVLFGSRAMGKFRAGSDIDFAILAPSFDFSEFMDLQIKIDDLLLPYKVDLVLMHQIENENLRAHIKRVGKIFYKS